MKGLSSEWGLCPSPIEGGGIYFYKTNSAGAVIEDIPIDKHNHSSKALAYFLVHQFGNITYKGKGWANYLNRPTPNYLGGF